MEHILNTSTVITPTIFHRDVVGTIIHNKFNYLRISLLILFGVIFIGRAYLLYGRVSIVNVLIALVPLAVFVFSHIHRVRQRTEDFRKILKEEYGTEAVQLTLQFYSNGICDLSKESPEWIPYSRMGRLSDKKDYITLSVKRRGLYILFIRKDSLGKQVEELKEFLRSKSLEQMP